MEYMAAQMDSKIEGAQHAYEAAMQAGQQPAYPAQEKIEYPSSIVMEYHAGMTLRDRFAMAALQSGDAGHWRDSDYVPVDGLSIMENTARCAYKYADAMLKARAIT